MEDTMRDLLSKLDAIVSETALRDREDLEAKRKALQDLQMDPNSKDPEITQAIVQRKADLEREAKSKGFEESFKLDREELKPAHDKGYGDAAKGIDKNPFNPDSPAFKSYREGQMAYKRSFGESFEIGDEFGISFSEDHEIATTIVDILEDGIVIELDDAAISMLTNEGLQFLEGELSEGVAGAQKCWKGFRKVGTKAGTGANAGKRVNDCEKIGEDLDEYFQFEFPKGKDRGPRDHGTDELERREKSFRKHELAKDGRDYKDAMSPKSKSPFKGKYNIAGPKGKLPEDSVEESGLQRYTGIKKYGKDGFEALQKAGRDGADEEEKGRIKDKYLKKEDHGPENPDAEYNQGEYDREGDMAKDQLFTINSAAKELYSIIHAEENLPEWVQKKITLAMDYIDTARDYMKAQKYEEDTQTNEAEYQGRKVQLGKKMAGDVKKSKVYVRNPKGNVVKVNFGDKKMKIKKSNPARRKSFRARHNCANPGPRHKARYWSCRSW